MLCGPPGSGKSMAALRFPSILPPLSRQESFEVTRIYSVAGKLPRHSGLIYSAPFRKPHHSRQPRRAYRRRVGPAARRGLAGP